MSGSHVRRTGPGSPARQEGLGPTHPQGTARGQDDSWHRTERTCPIGVQTISSGRTGADSSVRAGPHRPVGGKCHRSLHAARTHRKKRRDAYGTRQSSGQPPCLCCPQPRGASHRTMRQGDIGGYGMASGTIARLLIDKGFGFIRDETGMNTSFAARCVAQCSSCSAKGSGSNSPLRSPVRDLEQETCDCSKLTARAYTSRELGKGRDRGVRAVLLRGGRQRQQLAEAPGSRTQPSPITGHDRF